jgi:hypothetical protein
LAGPAGETGKHGTLAKLYKCIALELAVDMPMTLSTSSREDREEENAFPTKKRKRIRADDMY